MKEPREIPSNTRRSPVKVSVPWQLYQAIIRIQADEELDWIEAAEKTALYIDKNSEKFKKSVKREANRLVNIRFMKQLNKGCESIRDTAFNNGVNYVRNSEDNFRVSCSICGEPMCFSSRTQNWNDVRAVLYEAFKNWYHTECR